MTIKRFKDFILEKIAVSSTDSPNIASSINNINDLEKHLTEFNTKKTDLQNIYMTATDEKDLINKLSAKQFINSALNKTQMKFENPLLGKYSSVCDFKKQISDLEKENTEVQTSIEDKKSQIGPNPTLKDSLTQDIESKTTDVNRIKARISELKAESDRIERLTMKELQELQKKIFNDTREIRQGREEIVKGKIKM
jgi:phage host-nuclease inhibitor protein Gam